MKIRFFEIDTSNLPASPLASPISQIISAPGLSAYAIDHAELRCNGISQPIDGIDISLSGDDIVTNGSQYEKSDRLELGIYHFGIKNYSLLFPQILVLEPLRADRMGQFYQEAEKAFDVEAWLSFMLMCGAILEHLLFCKIGRLPTCKTLEKVADEALRQNLIDSAQHLIVTNTRNARNVIHCNKMHVPYISRAEAMDARTLIEKLMLRI